MLNEDKLYEEFIKDLGYTIMEMLCPSSCNVYRIRDSDYKVIKISNKNHIWAFDHILKEHEVLKRVKGVDGIAPLKNFYKKSYQKHKIIAVIKEYIKGEMMGKKISDAKNQEILEQAVKVIHKEGYVMLDLWNGNIIIERKTEKPYIIDLGLAKSIKELPAQLFEEYKKNDLEDLERLFD
ncbi:MAG: serine/threonine-protein kinase [Nanoarchaeota archaeon]|nr:serine/threonine-protein kinase [Nanoarchaeota archaeon]